MYPQLLRRRSSGSHWNALSNMFVKVGLCVWGHLGGRRHNQLQYDDDGGGLYGGKTSVDNDGRWVDGMGQTS